MKHSAKPAGIRIVRKNIVGAEWKALDVALRRVGNCEPWLMIDARGAVLYLCIATSSCTSRGIFSFILSAA